MMAVSVHPRSRHKPRVITSQACTCGGSAVVLVTYRDGSKRVFCAPHSEYARRSIALAPGESVEELRRFVRVPTLGGGFFAPEHGPLPLYGGA